MEITLSADKLDEATKTDNPQLKEGNIQTEWADCQSKKTLGVFDMPWHSLSMLNGFRCDMIINM